MNQIKIFDTTLRDGEQSPGCSMNLKEKIEVAKCLERLKVDVIEAGFAISSPGDFESVKTIAETGRDCSVASLARATQKDIDCAWEAVKNAADPRIHVFLATSPLHMEYKLKMTPEQVLARTAEMVKYAKQYTSNIEFSCEDATRSDTDFLIQVVNAAVKNGARQAELCLSGIGERAGNASLEEFVMALKLRPEYYGVECSIVTEQLYPSCHLLSLIIGRPIPANKAIIGSNAFAHESGIHQDGMLKNRNTYEIMTPQAVGRKSTDIVIGKHSGRNAVRTRLEELGYTLDNDQVNAVFAAMKELADKKARIHDEDLEALVFSEVYRMRIPDRFRLSNICVQTTMGSTMPTTAAVVMQDRDNEVRLASFGVGPIDAAFNVISQICGTSAELEKFSVNAITGGTDAQGEVSVHLRDGKYSATGRGSDLDIIVASAKAYVDALNRLEHKEKDVISYKQNPVD